MTITNFSISEYEVNNILGKNPNKKTIIYQATRTFDHNRVVLKTNFTDYPNPKELSEIDHEYRLLQKFNLPQIIKAYDLIHQKNRLILALEYFESKSLKEFIKKERNIELEDFYKIAIQLCEILEKIHQNKIIHKDFNPGNILIDPQSLEVKVIDFSISSELSFEISKTLLEGTLEYISPEQTGRTNRVVDFRSDFYSLGVTFYEMLAGTLPFQSEDPLELIFMHLTHDPPQISKIPNLLGKLVNKLMSKNAEDRYKSAAGIKADLIRLAKEDYEFSIGDQDFSWTFTIPQKLYGREDHVNKIYSLFQNFIQSGQSEILLVTGPSGMGKSVLIQEVQKPLLGCRGAFIKGKYDILQRGEPYFGIVQALKELIQYLLAQENLEQIKNDLKKAIGNTGKTLANLVPEIALLMDNLPELEYLPPKEAQNRLHVTFERFFQVIATKEHPLVLFLDDLQGVDQSSMELIQSLLSTVSYLFIIGAYRDNEVSETHPLLMTLKEIQRKTTLTLEPLSKVHIKNLLNDTFQKEENFKLAEQVSFKTSGNPFFVKEFLKNLFQQNLIIFKDKEWNYNLKGIEFANFTDNVLDLLKQKIKTLSPPCQQIIGFAACVGGSFELKTLSIISEKKPDEVASLLWESIQAGLLITHGSDYKQAEFGENIRYQFLHDKIQEAAYELISQDKKPIHLKVARQLLNNQQGSLFEILDHYNLSLDLLTDPQEKELVAELYLKAAKKSKSSNAYQTALKYFDLARSLLQKMNFDTEKEYGECLFLVGQFDQADKFLSDLLRKAPSKKDKIGIYSILVTQYCNVGKFQEGLLLGLEGLKLFGIRWSLHPSPLILGWSFLRFQIALFFKGKKKLLNGKFLEETPEILDEDHLIGDIAGACYKTGNKELFLLLILDTIRKGIQTGNTASTAIAHGGYFIVLNSIMKFKYAPFWAEIAFKESEYLNSSLLSGKLFFLYAAFFLPWFKPLRESLPYFLKGLQYSFEAGDFTYICYGYFNLVMSTFFSGKTIEETDHEFQKALVLLQRSDDYFSATSAIQAMIRSFQDGKTDSLQEKIQNGLKHSMSKTVYFNFLTVYSILHIIDEDYKTAFKLTLEAQNYRNSAKALAVEAINTYLLALSSYELYPSLTDDEKKLLNTSYKEIELWSRQSPKNFLHLYLHLSAELAFIKGNILEASSLFSKAIDAAEDQEVWFLAAIISERASLFYSKCNKKRESTLYLQIAYYHYSRWGANEKVLQLEKKNPSLQSSSSSTFTSLHTTISTSESLDYLSLLKATQTLSSEIILDKLLDKLVKIVKESAGAQRVLLISQQADNLFLEVEGFPNDNLQIYQGKKIGSDSVPLSIVNYVLRTKKAVVLQDAAKDCGQFQQDPYFNGRHIRSVLCTPILYLSNPMGVLYLENNLSPDVFTDNRLQVLNVISSQAAISLENARLYKASDRFVPTQFLKALGKRSMVDVKLDDQVPRNMTILVCDIWNFTSMSEKMTPKETFAFLNNFLGVMEPIIRTYHGFIDKYIGDAIMALFSEEPENALNASIKMLKNLPPNLRIGIGINTGEVILGILGGEMRFDGSVIGDSVNVAFRIESLTKEYNASLLISDNTKKKLKNSSDYVLRLVDEVRVKGKSIPIAIWEVCDADPDEIKEAKIKTLDLFIEAREAYLLKDFERAKHLFQSCLEINPSDAITSIYIKKCEKILAKPF